MRNLTGLPLDHAHTVERHQGGYRCILCGLTWAHRPRQREAGCLGVPTFMRWTAVPVSLHAAHAVALWTGQAEPGRAVAAVQAPIAEPTSGWALFPLLESSPTLAYKGGLFHPRAAYASCPHCREYGFGGGPVPAPAWDRACSACGEPVRWRWFGRSVKGFVIPSGG